MTAERIACKAMDQYYEDLGTPLPEEFLVGLHEAFKKDVARATEGKGDGAECLVAVIECMDRNHKLTPYIAKQYGDWSYDTGRVAELIGEKTVELVANQLRRARAAGFYPSDFGVTDADLKAVGLVGRV